MCPRVGANSDSRGGTGLKSIVLGVSGSVACYRACDIARELMRQGYSVRVCLTDSATRFVTPDLFEALTGNPCLEDTFDEPIRGKMAHIEWARQADLLVIAPATANIINKIAGGIADDMLTTVALAYQGPIVVAPAMNPTMFENEVTQRSIAELSARGVEIVYPSEGEVACGEQGQGKLASIDTIVRACVQAVATTQLLAGKEVLITCGPTQEPIDDVRFLSNQSSGKMGIALANAALSMGANVNLVAGPIAIRTPLRANTIRVRTAQEMLDACLEMARTADFIIGAAAVADFRVANQTTGKIRRQDGIPSLDLEPNPDIIAALVGAAKSGCKVIGFAAEPSPDTSEAQAKLARKGLDAIVFNDVSNAEIGFESDENEVTLITAGSQEKFPKASKVACAKWIWQKAVSLP